MTEAALMRCDGCKYWNLEEGHKPDPEPREPLLPEDLRPTVGLCQKAQPYWETTEWAYLPNGDSKPRRVSKPEFEGLKMFVQDGSDYKASLLTTGDFYCAHFSAASKPTAAKAGGGDG